MWWQFLAVHYWQLALLAVLLACSGFFSGTETAFFGLTRGQLHRLAESSVRGGRMVASLMRRPRRVLNTLLLGNMLVNVAFAGISAVLLYSLHDALEMAGAWPWIAAVVSPVPLVTLILVGEVAPKMLALVLGRRWAVAVAPPMMVIQRVLWPVLIVLEWLFVSPLTRLLAPRAPGGAHVTSDELAALLDLSAKRGIIDTDVNALLHEIIELTHLRVADIMVPRVDVIACDVDAQPEELLETFRRTHLRKLPVYEGDIDNILGVVHAKRLFLSPASRLRELVAPVSFVPEAANIERLLLQFRVRKEQMAIVVDEYGGTAGLVTLEDVLEEIVGDIPDPREAHLGPPVEKVSDREYVLDGDLSIHEWADVFTTDLASTRVRTVGGLVTSLLGRIPREGDTAEYRNLRFTVRSLRGRRIGKLCLELMEEDE